MAPPKTITTMLMLILFTPSLVQAQSPFYFNNYQPQQQQQQQPQQYQHGSYQPFTNAPPGPYFQQPTYQSPDENYYNTELAPTPPAANPLITYPTQTQVSQAPQAGHYNHLSPQPYHQPIGNSLVQQTPTVATNANTAAVPFRAPFSNHHTHIVNGLPRQQFFGNNYEFFRTRHGLPVPSTVGPFAQLNTLSTVPPPQQAPTAATVVSTAAPGTVSPTKTSETKDTAVKQLVSTRAPPLPSLPSSPPPRLFTQFPPFPFSPVPNHSVTTPAPLRPASVSTVRPTTTPRPALVSPSFEFSQFFPETDTRTGNELERQPLFQAEGGENGYEEEEEEEEDDGSYRSNVNSVYQDRRQPVQQARTVPQPQPPSQQYKAHQIYTSGGGNVNSLGSQAKDEQAPVRIHNTTPIRIVFNYEQAVEALQENPGVRVVVAHTEKNNLTSEEEFTTARPYQVPVTTTTTTPRPTPSTSRPYQLFSYPYHQTTPRNVQPTPTYQTTPRYVSSSPTYQTSPRQTTSSPILYQPIDTTPRSFGTHRPVVRVATTTTTTPRPQPAPTSRFQYQSLTDPYTSTVGSTATELENLALELEGRFDRNGRPSPSPRPVYETVATFATEPTTTENPLQTVRRGPKKYVVVPSSGNLFKAEEPRVVVNDLANIYVNTFPTTSGVTQFGPTQSTFPRFTSTGGVNQYGPTQSTFPRVTFPEYETDEVGQPVEDDLREEIDNLNAQLQTEFQPAPTTTTTSTTTTPRPPPPPPPPRIRVSPTPRLLRITTYRPPGTYRTSPRPTTPSPDPIEDEIDETPEAPESNSLTSETPSLPSRSPSPSPRYLYNNKQRNGVSGAHQRYEYNGSDSPPPSPPGEQNQRPKQVVRRRQRVRGKLIAGSPPRTVQVSGGPGSLGPVVGPPQGLPPPLNFGPGPGRPGPLPFGPGGPLAPIPQGVSLPGAVFRVGPRGRLLRRKPRPRPQIISEQPSTEAQQPSVPPSLSPSPSSPINIPDLPPVPQELTPDQPPPPPQHFPGLYNPTPFVPTSVPLVTTYRPGPSNFYVQQSLAQVEEEEARQNFRPGPSANFRSRFRANPNQPTAPSSTSTTQSIEEEEEVGPNQYDSEEDTPAPVPQRRRPNFSTTTTTTEKPVERQAISDRANILQRQIRFNRNRGKNQNNKN